MTRWRLEVISPVHIGSGGTYEWGEVARVGDRYQVLHPGIALACLARRSATDVAGSRAGALLRHGKESIGGALEKGGIGAEDLERAGAFLYEVAVSEGCAGKSLDEGRSVIREAAKRASRECYVPGSSVKGVLRTALAWHAVRHSFAPDAAGDGVLARRVRLAVEFALGARRIFRDISNLDRGTRPERLRLERLEALLDGMGDRAFESRYGFRVEPADRAFVAGYLGLDAQTTPDRGQVGERLLRALDDMAAWGPNRIGQEASRLLFGHSPATDVLRALCVSDSVDETGGMWTVYPTRVFATDRAGAGPIARSVSPEYFECLPPGFTAWLDVSAVFDAPWLDPGMRRLWMEGNDWAKRSCLLDRIPEKCLERSREQIEIELERARNLPGTKYLEFHQALRERAKKSGDSFLLRIGGRNGWDMNVITPLLGERVTEELRRRFRLGKMETVTDARGRELSVPVGPFPKTRQIVVDRGSSPTLPLGWVEISPERGSETDGGVDLNSTLPPRRILTPRP